MNGGNGYPTLLISIYAGATKTSDFVWHQGGNLYQINGSVGRNDLSRTEGI